VALLVVPLAIVPVATVVIETVTVSAAPAVTMTTIAEEVTGHHHDAHRWMTTLLPAAATKIRIAAIILPSRTSTAGRTTALLLHPISRRRVTVAILGKEADTRGMGMSVGLTGKLYSYSTVMASLDLIV
jgi:hypothetical protein